MKQKRFLVHVVALYLSAFLSLVAEATDDLKIGFLPPLTGIDKQEGITQVNAARLAVSRVNSRGGIAGRMIKLVIIDNASTAKGAAEGFAKLVDVEKVDVVIGPVKTRQMLAMLPKIKSAKIPTMTGAQLPRIVEEGDHWIFRLRPELPLAAKAMVKYLKEEQHAGKIAILSDDAAFGIGGANYVAKTSRELNMQIVKRVELKSGEHSYKKALQEVKALGADAAVIYFSRSEDMAVIETDWAALGKPFIIIGPPFSQTEQALKTAKASANDAYAVVDIVFGQNDVTKKFLAAYESEFKSEPDPIYSYTYDAVEIIAEAFRAGAFKSKDLRDAILRTADHNGVMGKISFDQLGNGVHEVSIVRIKNEKPVLVKVMSFGKGNE